MSQVKKLATGGTFIIDGREINGTDALNAVRSNLGETTGGIMNALQEGATVNYNSADNTIRITNSDGNIVTNSYLPAGEKASPLDSRFKKDIGATFHTKTDRFKRDLLKLRGIAIPTQSKENETVDTLTQLRKGSGWFYTKDKNGNNVYLEGPANADRMAVLKGIRDYMEHFTDFGEDESKKKYNTSGWSNDNLTALRNYFGGIKPEDREGYWTGLLGRIQQNGGKDLTDVDKETLRLMGFDDSSNEQTISEGSGNGKPTIDTGWTGDKGASERAGIGWKKDKDGRWEIIADPNNQFLTQNWWTAGLDFLPQEYQDKGFLLNGKLYKESEVYNNPNLAHYVSGWYGNTGKNWNDWYDAANNSGLRFVNDRIWDNQGNDYYGIFSQQFNPVEEYNEFLSPYFRNNNITGITNVADVTSQYESLPNGSKIFAYLDPTSAFNTRGVPALTYVYYNPNNKENPYSTNLEGLTRSLYGGSGNFDTYNYVNGKELGNRARRRFALHKELNIPGSDNSILTDDQGNLYLGKWNESAKDLRGHRITNMELLNEILANPNDPKWKNINLEDLYKLKYSPQLERTLPNGQKTISFMPPGFVGRKQGGTLPKFQYGGPIKNTNTTKTQKKTEDAKTDIVKPHKLDGSDGKLDSWEKMQIAAAIGDAVGVGLSFGGVAGGVAGAATGLASTGTRFAADIKKDGLDWGDVKRLGINTIFDLAALPASFIPGADNVIKGAKLVKTVKSIGQPVVKWLGTIGASTSTINIAKKWINGESPTSQDLAAFISGLGAGTVAGKQWSKQIGASKLAAGQSKAITEVANANVPKSVKAFIGENKSLEYTTKELSDLVNNKPQKEVVKTIIEAAKGQGVTIDEKGARNVLETLGVKLDAKGKLNFWVRKNGKWQWPGTRGETRVEFTPQKEQSAKGSFYYFTHPIARQRALGYMSPSNKQINLLENVTPEQYKTITSGSLRDNTISGALRRAALNNTKQFSNITFRNNPKLVTVPGVPGRQGYIRIIDEGSVAEPVKVNYGNSFGKYLPVLYQKPGLQQQILVPEVVRPQGSFFSSRRSLPEGFIPRGLLGQRNPQVNPIYGPGLVKYQSPRYYNNGFVVYGPSNSSFVFKKGGKIIKAQTGIKFNYDDLGLSKFNNTNKWVFNRTIPYNQIADLNKIDPNDNSFSTIHKEFNRPVFTNFNVNEFIHNKDFKLPSLNPIGVTESFTNPISRKPDYAALLGKDFTDIKLNNSTNQNTDVKSDKSETDKSEKDPGGLPGPGWAVNLPNLDDALRAAVTARGIYKDRDLQRKALGELYKRQFQTPQFDRVKYNFSDLEQGYNESVKPYLESTFVTSDARDSMAFKLNRAQQLSALAGQKNAQVSQRINQIDETNRQIDAQNETNSVQTANEKSHYLTGLNYQNEMLDSVALNRLFSDVLVPFGQQMSQQGRDAWNRNAQLNYQIYARQATDFENARILDEFRRSTYGKTWDTLSDKDKAKYGSLEDYVYSVDPEFWKKVKKPSSDYTTGMQNANKAYNNIAGAGLFYRPLNDYFKSGGTINIKNNNKNLRPAQEQIAINSAKSAKRSVDELSKALLRMLQQLTK